jgi:hypothetical protein
VVDSSTLVALDLSVDLERGANSVVVLGPGSGVTREEAGATDTGVFGGVTLEAVQAAPADATVDSLTGRAAAALNALKTPVSLTATVGGKLITGNSWRWGSVVQEFGTTLTGVFADNSYGIECIAGNYYVQNSRFQANNVTDALITAHSSSIRRSVSVGSAAFLLQTDNNAFGSAIKVVECLVSGWGSAAAPSAAILFQTRGPAMLIDSVFEAPAHAASPALARLSHTQHSSPSPAPCTRLSHRPPLLPRSCSGRAAWSRWKGPPSG